MRAAPKFRIALGGLIAVAMMSLFGLPAGAQDAEAEYSDVINTTLSRSTIEACGNEDVTATTTNLQPGSTVTFTLRSDPVELGTATADDDGVATLVFDLPAGTELGEHEIVTDGINSFGVADQHIIRLVVVACGTDGGGGGGGGGGTGTGTGGGGTGTGTGTGTDGGGDGSLADTGADLANPLRLAVVLFAVGAALILAARKRQAHTA